MWKTLGGMYGMFQGKNNIFIIVSTLFLILISIYVFKYVRNDRIKFMAWNTVLAGGISNIIDRIFRGFVIDFIRLKFFGVFNLADVYIVFGVIMIIFIEIKETLSEKRKQKDS